MEIPGYRIINELGQGGMATVWLAEMEDSGGQVAIKVLHPALCSDKGLVERFIGEGRTLSRLAHPHILKIFRSDILADGRPYLVMEYLQGKTLKDHLADRKTISAEVRIP